MISIFASIAFLKKSFEVILFGFYFYYLRGESVFAAFIFLCFWNFRDSEIFQSVNIVLRVPASDA